MVRGPESIGALTPVASILAAGQLPAVEPSVPTPTAPAIAVPQAPRGDALSQTPEVVEVQKGDTLGKLAARHNVSLTQLKALNPDLFQGGADAQGRKRAGDGHWIYPGEQVRLRSAGAPSPESTGSVAERARAASQHHQRAERGAAPRPSAGGAPQATSAQAAPVTANTPSPTPVPAASAPVPAASAPVPAASAPVPAASAPVPAPSAPVPAQPVPVPMVAVGTDPVTQPPLSLSPAQPATFSAASSSLVSASPAPASPAPALPPVVAAAAPIAAAIPAAPAAPSPVVPPPPILNTSPAPQPAGVQPPPIVPKHNPSKVFAVHQYMPRYGQTSTPPPGPVVPGDASMGRNGALIIGGLIAAMSLVKLPTSSEKDIGQTAVREALQTDPLYNRNPQVVDYVANVGKKLVSQQDRTDLDWNFYVVDSPKVNAYSLPGGHVFITTAALRAMKSENELAGVLAHEIAHVEQSHSMKKLQKIMLTQGIAMAALGNQPQLAQAAGQAAVKVGMNGYDQGQEDEADHRGVELAYQAGYDPHGLERFFETLKQASPDQPQWLAWTSDHPRTVDRITKVNAQLQATGMDQAHGTLPDRFQSVIRGL